MNYQASGMEAFEYSALPAHVIFGFGTLPRAAGELLALAPQAETQMFRVPPVLE